MNSQQKIERLEELLSRIKLRAAAPRGAAPVMPTMIEHAPAVVASAPPPSAPPVMLEAAHAVISSSPPIAAPHVALDPITTPPPSLDGYDESGEVEVSSEVVEVDIDIDEPMGTYGTEPPAELIEVGDDEELGPNTQGSAPPEEHRAAEAAANELEEPAPSSSRRPIAAEAAAEEEAEESAPRHTPPPESGKQVTASSPPPPRNTSIPPSSVEGHTLIGGWREPGMPGVPPTGLQIGVRVPPPPAPVVPPAQASGTRLSPDVSKPALPPTANVASMEGAVAAFKPASFGELLDATLGL